MTIRRPARPQHRLGQVTSGNERRRVAFAQGKIRWPRAAPEVDHHLRVNLHIIQTFQHAPADLAFDTSMDVIKRCDAVKAASHLSFIDESRFLRNHTGNRSSLLNSA